MPAGTVYAEMSIAPDRVDDFPAAWCVLRYSCQE